MKESEIRPRKMFNRYLELARRDNDVFFADRKEFIDVCCPGCGGTDRKPGLEKLGFCYLLCSDCDSLYLSPRPPEQMYARYYREAESVKFWSTHFYKETVEARREKIFRPRAEIVREWATRLNSLPDPFGTFVDIGSGYGTFLEEIKRLGIFSEIAGIEREARLSRISRDLGFDIIEKDLESVAEGDISADFATAFEVLEHVFDPPAFIRAARRIMRPGGLLMLTTLTVSGFDIQVLWENSKSVYPPHHINLISVAGMQRLMERCGLRIRDLATPGELDLEIVGNIKQEIPEVALPRFVSQLLNAPSDVRRNFQNFLKTNALSSHIRVVSARSPEVKDDRS